MATTVARIPYLGCEPFYYDMERRSIEVRNMTPGKIAAALLNCEIDAGPVPIIDCPRLNEGFQPLSGFCITAVSNAGATVLHSKTPIAELSGSIIAIPEEGRVAWRTILQGLVPVGVGVALGLVGSISGARLLDDLVFGIETLDLGTFLTAPTALVVVALAALAVPAVHASRIDPVRTLREE